MKIASSAPPLEEAGVPLSLRGLAYERFREMIHLRMIRLDAQHARRHRVAPAMQEHLEFIALIKARDEAGALRAMQEHLEKSRQRVVDAMFDRQPASG